MKPLTGPHAFGLISVPPAQPASNEQEQRLAFDKPQPTWRKTGRTAILALFLVAVAASFALVQVSYAVHQHFQR